MRVEIPKREIWTPPRAEVKLHNHFLAEIRNSRSGKLVKTAEAENVFTNFGRRSLAQDNSLQYSLIYNCGVGTGITPPAPSDERLAQSRSIAGIASSAQVVPYQTSFGDAATQTYWIRRKYHFKETVANFALTEVGLGYGNQYYGGQNTGESQDNYPGYDSFLSSSTRALFRDANGNPISITKTPDQVMTITATVYFTRGAVDAGMALLDNFFRVQVADPGMASAPLTWQLGQGNVALTNADNNISGAQLAITDYYNATKNQYFWDGTKFQTNASVRPPGKEYVTTYTMDWELQQAIGTFSEIMLYFAPGGYTTPNTAKAAMRVLLPCGNVGASSYTKNNQTKLRQYLEIAWG